MRIPRLVTATLLAAGLAFVAATPAWADHNAGANLDDFGKVNDITRSSTCYYGALQPGGPEQNLVTTDYRFQRVGATLTLVCTFTGIPAFVPEPPGGFKGDWYAPTTPKRYVAPGACLPPGTDSAGEVLPDGEGGYTADIPRTSANTVFYRSTLVMVCHWSDDPTR
ncbi:hypothetical protein HQQ80_08840 [Microbacteriaceae bacterium VKM Ac-2855]|nr:hypothetical protein [Microbacteriaceae bacterium VKM Ac-2855]